MSQMLDQLPADNPASSPNGFYFAGDDNLQVTVFNALASVAIRISGRFLHLDGRVEPFVDRLVPTSNRAASTKVLHIGTGWLLNVQVNVSAQAPLTGQAFAIVSVVRGQTGATEDLATLAAGYVTALQRIAWPGSPILNSLEGGGALRSITGTSPAAGAEISESVPTGARWELLAFRTLFTTAAAVANRTNYLTLDDGATEYFRMQQNATFVASQAWVVGWAQGLALWANQGQPGQLAPLPTGLRLGAGHRIKTVTAGIQAADQYSAVQYLVREWLEGA